MEDKEVSNALIYYYKNKEKVLEKSKIRYQQIKEHKKEYYEKNKETISDKRKEYYKENKNKIMEDRKEYYEINKEEISNTQKEYQKVYREVNKDEIIEKRKEFYKNNIEKFKKYYEENKDKMIEYHKKYREINRDKINESRRCNGCKLFYVTKKNNFLCSYCNTNKTKRKKTKEEDVKNLLIENNFNFIHDKKIINDCCFKYRPDFLFDCNTYFIVLEVDEDAHDSYDKECEIIRMNNISIGLGLPCKFIRYNPDNKNFKKKEKQEKLIEILNENLYKEMLDDIEVVYLFY